MPSTRAVPVVRLSDDGEHVVVLDPRADAAGFAAGGVPYLPPVPKSLTDWSALVCDRFRRAHGRCFAVVLLLELDRGRSDGVTPWAAVVPAQRCGRTAACWSVARADLPRFPDRAAVAGSFQTRALSPGEDPADCPPPHDGVHFVHTLAETPGGPQHIHCFLRAGGETRPVRADAVVFDDLAAAIAQARPRITFE
ncbi:MAG TPA: hypothetical protein VF796_02915 [Humisphaera sp.]